MDKNTVNNLYDEISRNVDQIRDVIQKFKSIPIMQMNLDLLTQHLDFIDLMNDVITRHTTLLSQIIKNDLCDQDQEILVNNQVAELKKVVGELQKNCDFYSVKK